MKLISWNIDSLNAALTSDSARAQLSRAVIDTLVAENADIIAIQETKLSAKGPTKKHLQILEDYFPDYDNTWRSSVEPARKGYAGTMFLYKKELTPIITYPEIGAPSTMDCEGRIITLEFDNFFVTQVYTPNAGDGLKRLLERQIWDEKYADYLAELDAQKPVLATGDYNVAHKEIDLANPSSNRRSPGFTDEEREKMTKLLDDGFIDTFRYFYPDLEGKYSWWSYRFKAREKNAGWRIDYFIVSEALKDKLEGADIHTEIFGSDHCPIELDLNI